MITAEHFKKVTGRDPEQDDLERSNCKRAGKIGHLMCGWDTERDMPNFIPGLSIQEKKDVERTIAQLHRA